MLRRSAVRLWLLAALLLCSVSASATAPVQLWDEADLRLRPGVSARVVIRVSIAEGYAVVGAGVQHAGLRPLQLRMQPTEGVRFGAPSYPRPQPAELLSGSAPVPAHTGVVAIRLPVEVAREAKWKTATLRGVLRFQVCRSGTCQPAQALPVAFEVERVSEADGG